MKLYRSQRLTPELAELLPRKARTFALAARFLPAPQRQATIVLYAFCRYMDDLVDEPAAGLTPREIRAHLTAWRRWLNAGPGTSRSPEPAALGNALRDVIAEYTLPTVYLTQLIDGIESDLDTVRMPGVPALERYCFLVAGTVGLAMCHVLGTRQPDALAAAAELGIAMQLTNILRDLGADLRSGRCYLPADELARFGYSHTQLQRLAIQGRPDAQFRALMRFQIERARGYYARGLAGVWLLPPEARPAILVAGRLYRAILDTIEASGYDVLQRRAVVSRRIKVYESLVALLLVRLWGDASVPAEVPPPAERLALLNVPVERLTELAL
jgi:phytoene synthase